MRSSGLNMRRFEAFTPTATTTSSNSVDARTMMSMCPLVTGSNDPGHAARRTGTPLLLLCLSLPGGGTVPKQGLAVLLRALPDEARRPLEVGAATGPLHHHECVVRHPVEIAQGTQRRHDGGEGHCVRRVQEDDVGGRRWWLRERARRRRHH